MGSDHDLSDPIVLEKFLRDKHEFGVVRAAIKMDIEVYLKFSAAFMEQRTSWIRTLSTLLAPSLICVSLYRIAHWCWCANRRRAARFITWFNQLLLKATITPWSNIGPGVYVAHPFATFVDADAGHNLVLYPWCSLARCSADNSEEPLPGAARPRLGNNVSLATFVTICGGVKVGDDVHIGPYVCVSSDVESGGKLFSRVKAQVRPLNQDAR